MVSFSVNKELLHCQPHPVQKEGKEKVATNFHLMKKGNGRQADDLQMKCLFLDTGEDLPMENFSSIPDSVASGFSSD